MARLSADSDDHLLNLINCKKLSVCKCVYILSLSQRHVHMHSGINSDTNINPCMFICSGSVALSYAIHICKLFSEMSSSGPLLVTCFFPWLIIQVGSWGVTEVLKLHNEENFEVCAVVQSGRTVQLLCRSDFAQQSFALPSAVLQTLSCPLLRWTFCLD